MLQSIWDDIRREFDYGNMISRIVIVNVVIFVAINLLWVFARIFNGWETPEFYSTFRDFFLISNSWFHNLTHPWSFITHMFFHEGFWHVLWNMLFLYWFGRIFGDLLGDRRVLPLYILGGLAGALFFILSANLTSYGGQGDVTHYALGASAAVMCILVATGLFAPDYSVRLFILGNVRLKYIVIFVILMEIISLGSDINTGGAFGHLGGIVMGFIFSFYLKQGTDLTAPVARAIEKIQGFYHDLMEPSKDHRKSGPRAAFKSGKSVKDKKSGGPRPSFMRKTKDTKTKPGRDEASATDVEEMTHQEQLDAILDKIKDRGYNSLTKDEKDFLFRASNRN